MSAHENLIPMESFVYRSQGNHSNPASEDYGWRSTVGGKNQWYLASNDGYLQTVVDGKNYDPNGGLGNYYTLVMDNGYKIRVGHVQRGSYLVKQGQRVARGQRICQMGNSGYCIEGGYHGHITVWDPNSAVVLLSQSGFKVVTGAVIYEPQVNMFAYESPEVFVGTPVERNAAVDQVIPRTNANMHSRPENNTQTILGKATIGYYNALETRDMTHEDSNRKYWYRVADGQWLYDADYFAGNPSVDKDKIIAELEAQAAALTKSAERLSAALVSVRDTSDTALKNSP